MIEIDLMPGPPGIERPFTENLIRRYTEMKNLIAGLTFTVLTSPVKSRNAKKARGRLWKPRLGSQEQF
jgi:hypothetical protein